MGEKLTFRKLRADEIEVRVKSVSEKGASALIYKTARTDMDILDETVGAERWYNDYKEIKGNLFCGICVDGVMKWDCGVESRDDGEGNEKKGEASDSFKRAGFRWGIGRELYTAPFIWLNVKTEKNSKGSWIVSNFATFSVKSIGYDGNRIGSLSIVDDKSGAVVYTFPRGGKQAHDEPKYEPQEELKPERTEEDSAAIADAIDKVQIEILQIAQAAGRDESAVARFAEKLILDNFSKTVKYKDMNLGFLITVKNALIKKIDAENAK
ncbi:hypothetical protein SDC9_67341 [bioreactor metagenome]|uniref:Uncharacterized protein n=1 Tax=bioreactor metagenome TaxID=1076179 RepID=A0A644Y311_9ZZZZ